MIRGTAVSMCIQSYMHIHTYAHARAHKRKHIKEVSKGVRLLEYVLVQIKTQFILRKSQLLLPTLLRSSQLYILVVQKSKDGWPYGKFP